MKISEPKKYHILYSCFHTKVHNPKQRNENTKNKKTKERVNNLLTEWNRLILYVKYSCACNDQTVNNY